MIEIAKINKKDRQALFTNTAIKKGLTEAIIEKDFWVCYMLDLLFHRFKWGKSLAFKGGTSLSKSYNLIKRFSEDIDLILDWRVIGYSKDEPWKERSNTQQDLFREETAKRTESFLKDKFLPELKKVLKDELVDSFDCFIDDEDLQTIIFKYPRDFTDKTILPVIKLEIGALAAWSPIKDKTITPYAAEEYSHLFKKSTTVVPTVLPERTFWEKITILHMEANRPEGKKVQSRYSRHYYDIYCMANSYVKDLAFENLELLDKVANFKSKFYRAPWAKYEEAKPGTIKLVPPKYNLKIYEDDYNKMDSMIYGTKPSFEELMIFIDGLEKEINNLIL